MLEYKRTGNVDMALPDGKTCRDCRQYDRCAAFIGIKGHETECDWSPSRFMERQPLADTDAQEGE